MAFTIPQLANTDSFYKQFTTINLLVNALSTSVLTTGSNTTGDAGVTNNFFANSFKSSYLFTNSVSANTLTLNTAAINTSLYVGNSASNVSINSTSITIGSFYISTPNTVQSSNGQYFLNANGNFTTVPAAIYPVTNTQISVNTFATTVVDTWQYGQYNLANYNLLVIDNNANNYYSSKLSVLFSSNNINLTEFAQITTNTTIGAFTVTTNATNVILNYTPATSNNVTVRVYREIT